MTQREKLVELLMQGMEKSSKQNIGAFLAGSLANILADYLLENGVIVPPCKVGDKIWLVFSPKHPANPADKGKWFVVEDGVQRIIFGAKGLSIETWNIGTKPEKEINKKLFFTKEEAEKALAERSLESV